MEKRIEVVTRRVGDLKLDFGNPRKIKKQKKDACRNRSRNTVTLISSS